MKKSLAIVFAALLVMAMILTSCGKSEFACTGIEEKSMTVHAENAGTDMEFTTGQLVVEDGDELLFESSLSAGTVEFGFIPASTADEDADPEEVISGEAVQTISVGAGETNSAVLAPGTYMVKAAVTEKATGDITITVNPTGQGGESWSEATSTEDAGEKAGVGLFLCDPQGTSLGPVTNADYSYMEGVASAHYGLGAVDMYVRKGLSSVNGGDVSFDTNSYANEWTHDHNGIEVKCSGNREGEATKSIWTDGDYSYCILAYGAGGDDDYGLSAEDLDTVMNDLQ